MKKATISVSFLTADFSKIEEEIKSIATTGVDWIHCDVMDGKFVPNTTFDWTLIEKINQWTDLPLDVHLMISNPEDCVENYCKAGADVITFHFESTQKPLEVIEKIKKHGKKAGIAVNPSTSTNELKPYLDLIDMALVMSVIPGFPKQKFILHTLDRIENLRKLNPELLIEVDGGIYPHNVQEVYNAGCDVVVAGNAIFSQEDRPLAVKLLRGNRI